MSTEETTLRTWFVDDAEFFPDTLLGLRKPDGGFFLALEGQSTDDGKVFINTLGDQEDLRYTATVIRKYAQDELVTNAKVFLKGKKFKQDAINDESEHGLAFWNIDDEKMVVVAFSTQRSDLIEDQVANWLGAAQCGGIEAVHGFGDIRSTSIAEIESLRVQPRPSMKVK